MNNKTRNINTKLCIKVLHFIESCEVYGAENVILSISKEMLKNKNYEPVVGCIVQHENEQVLLVDKARKLGIKAEKIIINNWRVPLDIFKASRKINKMGIGIIHSHGYKPAAFGFFISKCICIPIIATCHLWFFKNPPFKYIVMTKLEMFVYRFFPKIVCVSDAIKKVLIERGINDKNLAVIENGIAIDSEPSKDEKFIRSLKEKISIPDNIFIVINVGRLCEQKAQVNIINTAERFKRMKIKILFLIVGNGELESQLKELIGMKKLENEVRLLGFRENVCDIMKIANLFFLPSLDEGLPISLLEAMASKLPVVVTGVGAIPNVVRHEQEGLIVKINDIDDMCSAILRIKENEDVAEKFSKNGYERVRLFYSSESMFKKYEKIYAKLLL